MEEEFLYIEGVNSIEEQTQIEKDLALEMEQANEENTLQILI